MERLIREFEDTAWHSREDREHAERLLKKLKETISPEEASEILTELMEFAKKRAVVYHM